MKNWKMKALDFAPLTLFVVYAAAVILTRNGYLKWFLGHEVKDNALMFLTGWVIGVFAFVQIRSKARMSITKLRTKQWIEEFFGVYDQQTDDLNTRERKKWYQIGPLGIHKMEVLILFLLILVVEILLILVWTHRGGPQMWLIDGTFTIMIAVLTGYVGEAQFVILKDAVYVIKNGEKLM